MAIVSFWSNGEEETGKSSIITAVSTLLGVNHNYKVLVLDTKYNDYFYQDCFWQEDKTIKLINSNDKKNNTPNKKSTSKKTTTTKVKKSTD